MRYGKPYREDKIPVVLEEDDKALTPTALRSDTHAKVLGEGRLELRAPDRTEALTEDFNRGRGGVTVDGEIDFGTGRGVVTTDWTTDLSSGKGVVPIDCKIDFGGGGGVVTFGWATDFSTCRGLVTIDW